MRVLTILLIAGSAVGTGCGARTIGAVPQPFPRPGGWPGTHASDPAGTARTDAYAVTSTALQLRGSPYREGGDTPLGFDCSGFIRYVFAQHGIGVPRQVADQYETGAQIAATDLRPGDLLFFSTIAPGASHVALSIGRDEFVHAPSEQGVVRVERLSSSYWSRRFIGARRIVRPSAP
jgi:cell wall-associated NlpC family hydrolase